MPQHLIFARPRSATGPAARLAGVGSLIVAATLAMSTSAGAATAREAASRGAGTAGTSGPASATAVATPASGALFGAQVNPRGGADQLASINAFQTKIGRRLDIANKYHPFSDHTYKVEAALLASGRTPMISWRATDAGTDPRRAAKIAAGQYDAVIARTAESVSALHGGVLVRFNWEMDQSPGERQYIGSPAEFVAAWRRIVSIFRAHGTTNAAFVWAPRAAAWRTGVAASFYPGASYVDWIGASAVPTKSFPTFAETFRSFYGWAAPTGKPLLTWAGVRENPSSASYKAGWMTGVSTTLQTMPRVKAFVYYHALSPLGYAFWADTSTRSLAAYKAMGCRSYFDTRNTCA